VRLGLPLAFCAAACEQGRVPLRGAVAAVRRRSGAVHFGRSMRDGRSARSPFRVLSLAWRPPQAGGRRLDGAVRPVASAAREARGGGERPNEWLARSMRDPGIAADVRDPAEGPAGERLIEA
jgi:hypothetical protein